MTRRVPDVDELRTAGLDAGLDAVGVAPAAPFESTRRDLEDRKARGLHAGMAFTYRNPARSTDPGRAVAGARRLVVGARRYHAPARRAAPAFASPSATPTGRVAAYATDDNYTPLRDALGAIARVLDSSGWKARVVADDNALVDREAAVRAGLGWYGKNANVLLPGQGSWFVLGSVITDAPIDLHDEPARVDDGCGACRRCLDGCPTGAIVAPGVVDGRRCLAWLVQAPGDIPREFREAIGDRLYGCDDCQEVCPPNRRTSVTETATAAETETATAASDRVAIFDVLDGDDDTLLERFGRWYIPGRDPNALRRNALVVLGNTASSDDARVVAALDRYLHHDDDRLRTHAAWAARRLGCDDLLATVRDDPVIAAELAAG